MARGSGKMFVFLLIFSGAIFSCHGDNGIKDYNYLMFENFVLNEKIFQLELSVIQKVKNYRAHLGEVKRSIEHFIAKSPSYSQALDCEHCNATENQNYKNEDLKFRLKQLILDEPTGPKIFVPFMTELFNLVGESPSNVVGAFRGLVMLQETYNLDIIQMAAGTVSYHGKVFKVRDHFSFRIYEKKY